MRKPNGLSSAEAGLSLSKPTAGAPLLFVVGQLSLGGLERQLCYLVEHLLQLQHPVVVVVWNYRDSDTYVPRLKSLGAKIVGFDPTLSNARKLSRLRALTLSLSPAVVHSYSFFTNFAVWFACLQTRALPIGSLRSDFFGERKLAGPVVGRLSGRFPRTMIANNEAAAKAARRGGYFRPKATYVVRNGVDLKRFQPRDSWPSLPTAVGIGSLMRYKRWDRVLSVARNLVGQSRPFKVVIVGDGPERTGLQQLAQDSTLLTTVSLMQPQADVPALLNNSSFLIHASELEGCPNVVMEAMACGRPVLSTDVGDVSHLVEDGNSGFVVSQNDDDSLLNRMRTLIDDPDLCRRFGAAARRKAIKEFSVQRMAEETLAVYQNLRCKAPP